MNQLQMGCFLKQLREEKGMTQEKLAEKVGVSNRTVSRWENGKNMPDLSILMQLTQLYDVKLSEIVEGKRESEDDHMENTERQAIMQVAQSYREEKYNFPKKLNWLLLIGAVGTLGLWMDVQSYLSNICLGLIAGTSVSALMINTLYIFQGKIIDAPITEINEKAFPCTYKDTLSGVGGHMLVSAKGMRFVPHRLNTRQTGFESTYSNIDEMTAKDGKLIRNLLLVRKQGIEYRFLLEKKDRQELLNLYQESKINVNNVN